MRETTRECLGKFPTSENIKRLEGWGEEKEKENARRRGTKEPFFIAASVQIQDNMVFYFKK
jgi:hypothetical protein